jgi:hypothetical protein
VSDNSIDDCISSSCFCGGGNFCVLFCFFGIFGAIFRYFLFDLYFCNEVKNIFGIFGVFKMMTNNWLSRFRPFSSVF